MNETQTAFIDQEMPSKVSQEDVATELLCNESGGLPFDPEALRAKYLCEKEKRINNGGTQQYRLVNELSEYAHDIWAKADFTRAPVNAVYDVVIVGGGFTALQVACRLLEHGYDNICIIERGADFGGTWYYNRYPGAQCDIESYIYMPLIEEIGNVPTEKYARGPELYGHARAIAERYNLYQHAHLQTTVHNARWNDTDCMWDVSTDRNDHIKTRWVVSAPGPLQGAKFPGVPGIESFKGKSFHTSRWDYNYTGGSSEHPELVKLSDKRVGIRSVLLLHVSSLANLG
jgi:cyclohexanone monooxygenase